VTARSLRATFAMLLRDQQRSPATLSARAERTIRRRVVTRWTGRAAALATVTGLGAFAVTGALGATTDETITMPSFSPTPTRGLAVATFPFEGGPEFEVASSAYRCGDPAPAPHPRDHDLRLTAAPYADAASGDPFYWASASPLQALITKTTDTELGVVGTSGIDMLVVKDGIVVGMFGGDGPLLDVSASMSLHGGPSGIFIPVVSWARCPGEDPRTPSQEVDPGTYELIAVASVFSTPESVALSQALAYGNTWNLTSQGLVYEPDALYLPGSYDCQSAIDMQAPARPCLADFTPDAAVDSETRTVSLIYRTSDLVEEFSTVLVSEPITVELVSEDAAGLGFGFDWESLGSFDSLADLTCGSSSPGTNLDSDTSASVGVSVSLDEGRVANLVPGGTFGGTLTMAGVVDGSRVELLPGVRLVYFESTSVEVDTGDGLSSTVQVNTVAGWAPVALDGAITTDRYTGPQTIVITVEAATLCPDVDSLGPGTVAVVGTWHITAPDGTVSTVDLSADAGYDQYGAKYTY